MSREGYKMTELGEIPDDWDVANLNQIAIVKGGDGFPESYQGNQNGEVPFIKVSDMNLPYNHKYIKMANNYVDEDVVQKLKPTLFEKGTIVFAKVGAALLLNRRRITTKKTIIDNNMMGVTPSDKINLEYLYQHLLTIDFADFVQTGALPSVNQKLIGNLQFPTPPLPEQQKISTILSTLDATIENTESLIDKYRDIKKGLMADLLTRGIDENGRIRSEETHRFKDSPLGRVPEEWSSVILRDITSEIGDGIHSTPQYAENGKYFFINGNNLHKGKIIITKNTKMADYTEYKKYKNPLSSKTILLSINGTIGNIALYSYEPILLGKSAAYININENNSRLFIYYSLQTINVKNYFGLGLTGTTIKNLGLNTIRNAPIPLPPLPEQQKIASTLSSADEHIEKEESYRDKLLQLKKAMMQDLLTGQVRVKV